MITTVKLIEIGFISMLNEREYVNYIFSIKFGIYRKDLSAEGWSRQGQGEKPKLAPTYTSLLPRGQLSSPVPQPVQQAEDRGEARPKTLDPVFGAIKPDTGIRYGHFQQINFCMFSGAIVTIYV